MFNGDCSHDLMVSEDHMMFNGDGHDMMFHGGAHDMMFNEDGYDV